VFGGKGHEVLEMNAQDGTFFMRYESMCAEQRRVRCSCTLRLQLKCTSTHCCIGYGCAVVSVLVHTHTPYNGGKHEDCYTPLRS
jgi:hypothetical protein